ncbi:TPA: hypothetical protein SIA29_004236 [Aeromonas sobria]|nr:hypothetical protein [Aeromonas sobria]HEH9433314.1 hypothetical protein [Aeromonas sobria]
MSDNKSKSMHYLIQVTMRAFGFSLESIANRASALIWLSDNVGEYWPYYTEENETSIMFDEWRFIRSDITGEIVFSNEKVPSINKDELLEVLEGFLEEKEDDRKMENEGGEGEHFILEFSSKEELIEKLRFYSENNDDCVHGISGDE